MSDFIENSIYIVRGQRVILDSDLAALYGVGTKNLNKAVSRNKNRFPKDFAFKLKKEEWDFLKNQIDNPNLRFQFGTSSCSRADPNLRSQIVTSSYGGRRYTPYVFTEHGAYAAAFVLRSPQAKVMSIEVIRAFVKMRKTLAFNEKFSKELESIKSFMLKNSQKCDQEFRKVWKAIEKLSTPIKTEEQRRIGFDLGQ